MATVSTNGPLLWSYADVIRETRLSRSTVVRLADASELRRLRIGGTVQFDSEQVHATLPSARV